MQVKKDIWFRGKSTSVRIDAKVWEVFTRTAERDGRTVSALAEIAQREHNGSLAEAITAYVTKHFGDQPKHDACSLWLAAIIDAVREDFAKAGYPLPANIVAKIALPSTGWKGKAIGDYWGPHMHHGFNAAEHTATDGLHTIFVHPCETDPAKIVSTLVHELCHAADNLRNDKARSAKGEAYAPVKQSHGRHFKAIGEAMGLEGKPKCMAFTMTPEYASKALEAAGRMPHNPLNWAVKKEKAQTNRHLKFEHEGCPCAKEDKAPVWRMAAGTVAGLEKVACPVCGDRVPNPYFEGEDDLDEDGLETVESEAEVVENRLRGGRNHAGDATRRDGRSRRHIVPHSMAERCAYAEDKPLRPLVRTKGKTKRGEGR